MRSRRSAGGRSGTATQRGWVLKDEAAEQDQGRRKGHGPEHRGTRCHQSSGNEEVLLGWMSPPPWDCGGEGEAAWCAGFFSQWGCVPVRRQLMSCQGTDTFSLAVCGIPSGQMVVERTATLSNPPVSQSSIRAVNQPATPLPCIYLPGHLLKIQLLIHPSIPPPTQPYIQSSAHQDSLSAWSMPGHMLGTRNVHMTQNRMNLSNCRKQEGPHRCPSAEGTSRYPMELPALA